MKLETIDRLFQERSIAVLGTGHMGRLPAKRALLPQDRESAVAIAVLHGDGMVEHVENPHAENLPWSGLGAWPMVEPGHATGAR